MVGSFANMLKAGEGRDPKEGGGNGVWRLCGRHNQVLRESLRARDCDAALNVRFYNVKGGSDGAAGHPQQPW